MSTCFPASGSLKRALAAFTSVACIMSSVLFFSPVQAQMPGMESIPAMAAAIPSFDKPLLGAKNCESLRGLSTLPPSIQGTLNDLCGNGASSSTSSSVSSGSSSSDTGSSSSTSSNSSSSNSDGSSSSGGSSVSSSTSSSVSSGTSSSSNSSNSSSVSSSSSSVNMGNLIANPELETEGTDGAPAQWHKGGFGTNNAQFTYPVLGAPGKGAEIFISQYTDGDAKWYFDEVSVIPGEQYLFTDKYKSNTTSAVNVRYTMADGTFVYGDLGVVSASSAWQQFSVTLVPPANAVSLTVFHLLKSAGTLAVDTFALQRTGSGPQSDAFDQAYVSLDFDDGWTSHYRNVMPILNNAGLKGTFYVISNEARTADEELLNDPNAYLTYSKLLQLQSSGHEVSAHTRTHTSLVGLSSQQAATEVQGSRTDLADQGFTPVDTFAFPYGDYNANVIQTVKNAGFIGARSVDEGYNTKADNKYALKVQNVLMGTTAAQIKEWIDHAIQTKTWLPIVFHQVDTLNHEAGVEDYSTTPAILQEVVNYLKEKNVQVITNHQGIQMMP